jgi:polysaccharide chain length determinant protein (PEP-CTERM system associated)
MQEQLQTIIEALYGVWRFRVRALIVAWSIALAGWALVYLLPNQYEAHARVYVDTESVLRPLLSGLAVGTDMIPQVNMMTQALLSRPQLVSAARATDLHLRAKTPEQLERLVDELQLRIRISGGGQGSNLYTIVFEDPNPRIAKSLVQNLLNSFVESTLGVNRVDSTNAQHFLEQQIGEYAQRLTEAEERLAEFKRRNFGVMPGAEGDYFQRLQVAQSSLEQVRAALVVAQNRRDEIKRQVEGEEPTFGVVSPGGSFRPVTNESAIDAQIDALRRRIDELSVQFTDKHPDIIAAREKIAYLEQRKAIEERLAPPRGVEGTQRLEMNPVYQSLQIDLGKAEVEVRTLSAQLADRQNLVGSLRSRIDTIPEVEAQLAQLNRDYNVTKTQHEALMARLEAARLTENADQQRNDVKFRIIEPPFVPLEPSNPRRSLLLTVVLVLALLGGAGTAFAFAQIDPVFTSREQLRKGTGLRVLGVVSNAPRAGQIAEERRATMRVALAAGLLIACFGLTLLLADGGSRFIQRLVYMEVA